MLTMKTGYLCNGQSILSVLGLGNIKSLKELQLSHNKISEIGPADLAGCIQLNELHLQYNLINTIHPEAFKDLKNLKVQKRVL